MRTLSGKSEINSTRISVSKTDTGIISEPTQIADSLNNYFVNITSQLNISNEADNGSDDVKLQNFIRSRIDAESTVFEIPLITEEETIETINKIRTNTATGPDGISARVLKAAAPVLASPLQKLLNLSINSAVFPSRWKVARVTPIHKDGSRDEKKNYRPISVLCTLSKILEKHVGKSLLNYLQYNNLIYINQSAFRKDHSTETALINLTDKLLFDMDNDRLSGLVFIDFRKAFDVINHDILLKKLSLYGASDLAVTWFTLYLSARRQYVQISNSSSSVLPITDGVPQGSNLGPILFLLFINDLPLSLGSSTLDIYADDATLSASSKWDKPNHISSSLNSDLNNIEMWTQANKMAINEDKTKAMLVVGKRLRKREGISETLDINLNNKTIEQVRHHKLLGVELDGNLDFSEHIESLCRKLSKRIGLLKHISPYLKRYQRELYYNTVVKPVMLYNVPVWSYGHQGLESRIFKLQKRAARIITGSDHQSRSIPIFNSLNWLPFSADSI